MQHGLRAYTPNELKAVKAAAASFRANPAFKAEEALQDLGTGEALVSFLDEDGRPSMVERAKVLFPACRMAAADAGVLADVLARQYQIMSKYGTAIDRESAFELIEKERERKVEEDRLAKEREAFEKEKAAFEVQRAKEAEKAQREAERAAERARVAAEREEQKRKDSARRTRDRVVGSVLSTVGREASRQIMRGLFGTRR